MSKKAGILEKINAPQDVKKLTMDEMTLLAEEMRQLILEKIVQSEVT